jgi:hypothetical protein
MATSLLAARLSPCPEAQFDALPEIHEGTQAARFSLKTRTGNAF